MKILKIELQNINSLKSDKPLSIDFESVSFQDVGLFAITGATGAGKTTILDAITIALYNNVPRLSKPSAEGSLKDVVSWGAGEAMARVTFQNKGIRYEAYWDIRLESKSGRRLDKPVEQVRLKDLSNGKIIAEQKKKLKSEIERITQLDYNQFLRSVMLAQGEFAAFLSASSKDKGTLLEQITGEEIYKKIGESLNVKISDEKNALIQIESKINTEDLIPVELVETLHKEEEELRVKIVGYDTEIKNFDKILGWYKRDEELNKTSLKIIEGLAELKQDTQDKQDILEALAQHDKAEPFKGVITELDNIEVAIDKQKHRSKLLSEDIVRFTGELEKTALIEKEKKASHVQKETELNAWQPKLETVAKIETQIESLKKESEETKQEITALNEKTTNYTSSILTKKETLKNHEEGLRRIQDFLSDNKDVPEIEKHLTNWNTDLQLRKANAERISDAKKSIENDKTTLKGLTQQLTDGNSNLEKEKESQAKINQDLKQLFEELKTYDLTSLLDKQQQLNNSKSNLKQLFTFSTNYNANLKSKSIAEEKVVKLESEKKNLASNIENLNVKISDAQKNRDDASQIYELQRTIKNYEEERKNLKEGEPCVVCGATSHPLVEEYKSYEPSDALKVFKEREKILEGLQKEKIDRDKKVTIVKTKLGSTRDSLDTLKQQIDAILLQFKQIGSVQKIEKPDSIKKAIHEIKIELETLSSKIEKAQDLQTKKDKANVLLKSETENISKLEKEIVEFQSQIKGVNKGLEEKSVELDKLHGTIAEIENTLKNGLSAFNLTLPTIPESGDFISALQKKVKLFSDNTKALVDKKNDISQLRKDIQNTEEQLAEKRKEQTKKTDEYQNLSNSISESLERRYSILPEQFTTEQKRNALQQAVILTKQELDVVTKHINGLSTEKVSAEKQKQSTEKDLAENLLEHKSKLEYLELSLAGSQFDSREELVNSLLTPEKKKEYSEIKKELNDKSVALVTLQKELKTDLEKQEEAKDFELSKEEAGQSKEEIENSKESSLKRAGEITNIFKKDNDIRERNKAVVADIEAQEKILHKWNTLRELLGGSKDAFNTYVQRLTLQNLIQLANIHLIELNPRYSLKMNETYTSTTDALHFKLIDHYQTGEARHVDTSSGGEKFLISLALALGLSDLASQNVNVESLFIDEGFGTLDSNTLETVISTLETLQAKGKMIGVISHVENLKERITTQIQVNKKRNGVSVVEIV